MGTEDRPGALITVAGLSSRMGEFKPLLPVGGVPLLEAGIRALRAGGVGPVYVVTGHRAADLRPLLARMDAVEIHNPRYAETDMFASVRLGLERAAADCGRLFLMPGDVALFRAYSVHAMDEAQREHDAGLVIPTCRETPGHPVLLGRDCIAHVLRHDGSMGLRGALDRYPGRRALLLLPDPGLLLDADTPEDYRRLLVYHRRRAIPDREGCMEILSWFRTPAGTVAHCEAVARTALDLAAGYNAAGGALNLRLVLAGALLHDLAKGHPDHARTGEAVLRALECPAVAAVGGAHTDLPSGALSPLDERALVYYADKITRGAQTVTLEERFSPALVRFRDNPAARAAAAVRLEAARRVEQALLEAGLPRPCSR